MNKAKKIKTFWCQNGKFCTRCPEKRQVLVRHKYDSKCYKCHYCVECLLSYAPDRYKDMRFIKCSSGCKRVDENYWDCDRCTDIRWYALEWKRKRENKGIKESKEPRSPKSLLELCCEKVSHDPLVILYLTQINLSENIWNYIESCIPPLTAKRRKEELIEAMEEGGKSMCRVIGKLFKPFVDSKVSMSLNCK